MSRRFAAVIAWSLCAFSAALAAGTLVWMYLNGSFAQFFEESLGVDAAVAFSYPAVGALIASRRPGNWIGWIFCAIGLSHGLASFAAGYEEYAFVTEPGSLPLDVYARWLGTWIWLPGVFVNTTLLLLLFPDGRLPSRRWLPAALLSGAVTVAGAALLMFGPWDLIDPAYEIRNPFEIEGARPLIEALFGPFVILQLVSTFLCGLALVLRFRRARGIVRQQIKWFAYAGVLYAATFATGVNVIENLQFLIAPLLPVAAAVAILRYRLYDIDEIINRTLVYGALTASLILVYLGSVVSLQYAFRALTSGNSQLAIVASTLLIAALFNPLRRRLQAFIDRRFYRSKYDARKTLEEFGARLRDETDLEGLGGELVGVVRDTVRPAHVSLWLRPSDGTDNHAHDSRGDPGASR